LSRQVASGDVELGRAQQLADYYAASGMSPGRWYGHGLAGLAGAIRPGDVVAPEAMTRLFRDGCDPTTGQPLGVSFAERRGAGSTVAGFDLVFTVPKAASVLWALGDEPTRAAVVAAHRAALTQAVDFLEDTVVRTRIGAGGRVQVRTGGLVAAGFEHVDSRLNDPNLHTHLVVANKVQGRDGTWRSLDGRTLLAATVAVSELYDGLLADEMTRRLGVRWELRDRGPRHNLALTLVGLPDELLAVFSRRTAAIDAAQQEWETRFVTTHGRTPTPLEVTKARQRLTRSTRPNKVLRPVSELFEDWANRARALTGRAPHDLAARALLGQYGRTLHAHDVADEVRAGLVATVVGDVEGRAATFTTWNLTAAAARATRLLPMTSSEERIRLVGQLVVAAAGKCVRLDDGEVRRVGEERFTTPAILAAEQDLLTIAAEPLPFGVMPPWVLDAAVGVATSLSEDQRAAAAAVLGSGRVVDTVVGPAGSGKTTALRLIVGAWTGFYGQTAIALAPSATAARVLGDGLGVRAETTAKWLFENGRNEQREEQARNLAVRAPVTSLPDRVAAERRIGDLQAQIDAWTLRRGQIVMLDEASLADTPTLAAILGQAATAGAKVVLVGDPEQKPAIGPGGGFGMLTHRHITAALTTLHRFAEPWEAGATLRLRMGDPRAVDLYRIHGRIRSDDPDTLLDQAVAAAADDTSAGKVVLLQATDTRTVRELNVRAHQVAVLAGRAARAGAVRLADDATATVGDRVVTRRNDRRARTPDGFVRNGDLWDVVHTVPDGSLVVAPTPSGGGPGFVVRLAPDYVRAHVELGYATTTARAQGATVDITRTVVTPAMAREDLYVAVSRGRERNELYVPTGSLELDCPPGTPTPRKAADVLRAVLATNRIPTTATETWAKHHPGEPLPTAPNRPQPGRSPADRPQILPTPSTSTLGPVPPGRVVEESRTATR
jgi:conjugative relaxase-like TrwC/TraI family protein